MSKRKPTEQAAPAASTEVQESKLTLSAYREVTETRHLMVVLLDTEKTAAAQENARLVRDIADLEDAKKASASNYKARIEEKQARQNVLSTLVLEGREERPVKCQWLFECSGRDAEGKDIVHPEKKSLVRLDTGEVIEVQSMNEADFANRELALNDGAGAEAEAEDGEDLSGE